MASWAPVDLPSPEKLDSLQLHFGSQLRTKRTKIVATFHRLDIYLNCDCDRGSAPDPTGELIALPSPHLDLREQCHNGESRAEWRAGGNGVEGWEKNGGEKNRGMERKGRLGVDFALCKNSSGRPFTVCLDCVRRASIKRVSATIKPPFLKSSTGFGHNPPRLQLLLRE